jgi:hypothetical protein
MSTLIERIRRARETTVEASGFKFTVRRPTDLEMHEMQGGIPMGEVLKRFVTGWDGVTELDLAPGGTGTPVVFDTALFAEWIADRPDLWAPLTQGVLAAWNAHQAALEESAKN